MGFQETNFWRTDNHETAIFDKKPKTRSSSYHFLGALFFSLEQQKAQKLVETPISIVFSQT